MMIHPDRDRFSVDRQLCGRSESAPLDAWIAQELRRSFDATLAEPVPEELLGLLAALPR